MSKIFYSVLGEKIGEVKLVEENGIQYITCENVHQRLKIDKSLSALKPNVEVYKNGNNSIARFEYPVHTFLCNNRITMNPFMIKTENIDVTTICIMLKDVKLISYSTSPKVQILNSFHDSSRSVGCFMTILNNTTGKIAEICYYKGGKYYKAIYNINKNKLSYTIEELKQAPIKEEELKGNRRFKITTKTPCTLYYITDAASKNQLNNILSKSKVKHYNIKVVDENHSIEDILKAFHEKHIRALTTFNVEIDKAMLYNNRIIYLYDMNSDGIVTCVSSN